MDIIERINRTCRRYNLTAYAFCRDVLEGLMRDTQLKRWIRGVASPTGACFACKKSRAEQIEAAITRYENKRKEKE